MNKAKAFLQEMYDKYYNRDRLFTDIYNKLPKSPMQFMASLYANGVVYGPMIFHEYEGDSAITKIMKNYLNLEYAHIKNYNEDVDVVDRLLHDESDFASVNIVLHDAGMVINGLAIEHYHYRNPTAFKKNDYTRMTLNKEDILAITKIGRMEDPEIDMRNAKTIIDNFLTPRGIENNEQRLQLHHFLNYDLS